MLKTALERTGNVRVTYVQESRKGLALLEARHFDLLITDYRIPGIDGMQLAQQARQRRPEMGILVITATPTLALREALTRIDRCELIRKPFSINVIRQAVAGLLAASHTP
jgi:DNA-binding NtrC family response regulator